MGSLEEPLMPWEASGTDDKTSSGRAGPAPLHKEEIALVQACICGDRESWGRLLVKYERTMYFAIVNTMRVWDVAYSANRVEDIQNKLVVVLSKERFRKLRLYSGRCRLRQWLKVVTSNFTVDHVRRLIRERRVVSLSGDNKESEGLRQSLTSWGVTTWPDHQVQERQGLSHLRDLYKEVPEDDLLFVRLFLEKSGASKSSLM